MVSARPLLDESFVVVDFETTGLSPRRGSDVVETGAVRFESGRATHTFQRLSRPVLPIPESARRVHGISDDMVAQEARFSDVLPELLQFLGTNVFVAHHARFDAAFLQAALRRTGRRAFSNPVLCTVRLSRRLFPELPRHDLTTLCDVHRIRRRQAHRALDDALATAELLSILVERAAECGLETLEKLLALGGPPPPRRPENRPAVCLTGAEQRRLEEAMVTGDRVGVSYLTARGRRSGCDLVPYSLELRPPPARLIAYDLDAGRTRVFRLDRLLAVAPREDPS